MAWRAPTFNVWAAVYRPDAGAVLHLVGYSKCQYRGPTSHSELIGSIAFEVLFPKFSDIRDVVHGAFGADIIEIGGWGRNYAVISGISDKGAGFTNEYRLAICTWRPRTSVLPPVPLGQPPVDPLLEPPTGFTPLPLLTPGGWIDPPT